MYNSSEEDLFPGHKRYAPKPELEKNIIELNHDPKENFVKPFDPLKAQTRRAEIYKRALEMVIDHYNFEAAILVNTLVKGYNFKELDIDQVINVAKFEVDNAAQS